jgi:uncharacterized protein
MTATLTGSAPTAVPSRTRRVGRARETLVFRLATALIGLHVLDDNFVQPQPGTAPGDHLVSGLVPLALLGLAAWAYPRLRGGLRAAIALAFGVLGVTVSIEALYYAREIGPSGDDFTGLLALPAGPLLLGLGVVTLWQTRRTDGNRAWRYARRGLLAAAAYLAAMLLLLPVGFSYVVTHTARAVVPPDRLGMAHEDVTFTTSDGLELEGWYVPSRNGAAVIAFPGRNGPQAKARMLARHGYGVLLFDRRGEGRSEGEPNVYGWGGERDIKAAIAFLQRRPDVDPERIGGIGLSVGGEMMLEAAAETDRLKAVVSEGAGPRAVFSDEMGQEMSGGEKLVNAAPAAIKMASLAVFSNQAPPANLNELVGRIAPRPLLLIAAPNSPNGEELNRGYHAAAGASSTLWEIPESTHVGGQRARPQEYERRVIAFLDGALLR